MRFSEALGIVFNSPARIRRPAWPTSTYVSLVEAKLCITGGQTTEDHDMPHPWIITDEDWFADDWEVVE